MTTNQSTPSHALLSLLWHDVTTQLRQIIVSNTAETALMENFALLQRAEKIGRFIEWLGSEENDHVSPEAPLFWATMKPMPKLCFLALNGDLQAFDSFVQANNPFPLQSATQGIQSDGQ